MGNDELYGLRATKDLMYWDDKGVPAYLLNKVNAVATNDIGTWIVVGGSLYDGGDISKIVWLFLQRIASWEAYKLEIF